MNKKQNLKKKIILLAAAFAAIIIAGTLLITASGNDKPADLKDLDHRDPNSVRNFFESDKFQKMEPQQKRQAGRQVMEEMIKKTADEYCSLLEEDRTAYLDKVIDQMARQREEFAQRRQNEEGTGENAPPPGPPPGGGQRPGISDFRARSEGMDSSTHAKMTKFMTDFHQRMQQRGMDRRR